MASESSWRTFLGPTVLLFVSTLIYLIRYLLWTVFKSAEPVFVMLILSYFAVLPLALFLLKEDSKRSLSTVLKMTSHSTVLVGIILALLYYGLLYLISYIFGSSFEFTALSLRGFENYAVYSLPLAFALYLLFAVFGAFAEEVAYRGYVQTRISSRYGYTAGIFVATLLFSLQHIHVFQLNWLEAFFQTQFFHVMLFGVFVGYLFSRVKKTYGPCFRFMLLVTSSTFLFPLS